MWLLWTALAGLALLVVLGYREKKHKRGGVYTQPGLCYELKRALAWAHFKFVRLRRVPRVQSHVDTGPSDYVTNGFVPAPEDEQAEQLRPLESAEASDDLTFFGCDSKGGALLVRIVRRPGRQAEVLLLLQMDGQLYQLPGMPDTTVYNTAPASWEAAGLAMECVVPMRLWRITYQGQLRRSSGPTAAGGATCTAGELVPARLRLLWRPLSTPRDLRDCDTDLMVCAVARELWTPEFLSLMGSFSLDGYVQFGSLMGQVALSGGEPIEVRLRGPRQHAWSGADGQAQAARRHRSLRLQARLEDGGMLLLAADSWPDGITHLVYGMYMSPALEVATVTSCNLSLPDLAEEQHIPEVFNVIFTAGSKQHAISFISTGPAVDSYSSRPWRWVNKLQLARACLDGLDGAALAEFGYPYSGPCPLRPEVSLPLLVGLAPAVDAAPVVTFDEPACRCEALVGGKAASLALMTDLEKTFGDFSELRFAVRSSALGEDSEELSAAGQNDTVLGCRGREQIAAALTRCWASLFAHHSVEYRRQHGQHIHPGMAVVVQRMVTSEVSGVMFTRDPVTGDPSRVTVTANYGLGESVVSARVEPDTITLHRGHDDQLNITDRQLGSKQLQTVMAEDGGTEERPLEGGAAAAGCRCLSDADALRLARLGLQLEKAFGGARDVEWAVAEDTLYLLQSRPVTSFTGWTEFELTHECDSALLTDEECLTTANTGEVLPRGGSTRAPSLRSPAAHVLRFVEWRCRTCASTDELRPCRVRTYARQYCVLSHHRFGMDVTKTFLSTLQSWEEHDAERTIQLTILGHLEDWTRPRRTAVHRYGVLSWHARMHQMISMAGLTWHIAEDVRRGQRDFGRLRLRTDGLTTAQQALRHVCHELRHMQRVIQCHLLSSTWSQAPQMALLLLLAEDGARPFDQEVFSVFAMLLSSCSGAVSADVPSALERLARLIASSKDAAAFLSASQEDGLHWLRHRHTTVAAFFEDFLATHGHRALNELELHTTPWALDPGALVATLQTMVRNPDSLRNTKQETDVPQALSQLTVPLSGMTRRLVSFVLPYARRGVVQREQTKSLLVRMLHQFRLAFRRLAELMVRESRLPDSDLVFFLTLYEIQRLLDTRSPAIVTKALRRRRLFPKLDRMRFPEMIYGVPRPLAAQSSSQGTAGHLAVTGTPVCQGRVQGTARVVRDLAQAIEIQNDDILITHATDIGWSPYFPVLSGVVTELGGLISHGAVVAREYGLPCVVGATGATDLIQSGDIVILDGTLGTITRLQPSSDRTRCSVAEAPRFRHRVPVTVQSPPAWALLGWQFPGPVIGSVGVAPRP
ncbi:uncharacterized protein LOC119095838 [Pollicipes pollicipes]|uniref:uncharacterized protein LOC119095838 n=1 Tax=Pollicipes pollicipes TaxID=41117 RepID=UPI00188598D6|nr:uncharacterized protein LOC119095838 [Pollicipes pollicipes]